MEIFALMGLEVIRLVELIAAYTNLVRESRERTSSEYKGAAKTD